MPPPFLLHRRSSLRMMEQKLVCRPYTRYFLLLLACISFWWLVFVFQFSIFSTQAPILEKTAGNAVRSKAGNPLKNLPYRYKLDQSEPSDRRPDQSQPSNLPSDRLKPSDLPRPNRSQPDLQPFWRALASIDNKSDPCAGRYVYMHNIPSEFNQDLLDNCRQLSPWTNMCKYTENSGLGPTLEDPEKAFPDRGWFATNQFSVDVIFHNRMKQYECLTSDSGKAAALYVPFYAGLDIARHLWGANVSVRDSGPVRLARWLRSRQEWSVMGGRDHFVVGGRITWDFRRLTDSDQDWGNKLLYIAEVMNMSMLMVEKSPYHTNDLAVPYPTYFHPTHDSDIIEWQTRVRNTQRNALFSFAGAPRPELSTSIRGQIMDQCRVSKFCSLLECDRGESKCHVPSVVMRLFQESIFCLQPQGDSYTRRSIFDSMVAGCIPVFFHEHSAYTQYVWHLPHNRSKYSVFIPEDHIRSGNVSIEEVLLKFSDAQVKEMREEVIRLVPGLVYNDPRHKLSRFKDAFDLTVEGLVNRVTDLRMRVMEGRDDFVAVATKDAEDIRTSDLILSQREVRQWEGERRNGEHDTRVA